MTMVCQVCNSYNRPDVDKALMQGKSYSKIASMYDLDPQAIRNHHHNHLSRQLVQAWERKQDAESRDLLGEIDELVERTKGILDKAEKKGQLKTVLAGIRELRGSYELMSRIAFSLHQAKEKDIELARIESGEADYQLEQDFREKLGILSQPELMLFNAILEKIHTQDADMNPIGEALERKTLYMQWLESPDEFENAFNPLGIEHIDLLEPLKVEPLEVEGLRPGIDRPHWSGLDTPPTEPEPEPADKPMTRTRKAGEPVKRGPGRPPGSKRLRDDRARMRKRSPAKTAD